MFHKVCLAFIMLSLSVLLGACAHNKIYRGELSNCISDSSDNCEDHAIAHYFPNTDKEFHLGFIEYDDQGQLRDRGQMRKVLDTYSTITGTDDVIVIVFVHGWQHTAAPDDSNVESFKKLLTGVSRNETVASQQDKRATRKILGVYIGWRGDSSILPILKYTTFWSRKYTAQEVGELGVTEALLKLARIVNLKSGIAMSESKPPSSRMAILGHSFGGQVVYTALKEVMADRMIDTRGDKIFQKNYKHFANMVILINPAFEALRVSTLFDMSQEDCRDYPKGLPPSFVMLTSEADSVTRYIFPYVGRTTVLFESHEDINRQICTKDGVAKITVNEFEADRTTIGHFEPYQTHTLAPLQDENIRKSNFNLRGIKKAWVSQVFGSQLDFQGVKLTHLGRTHPLNPYLNIYVDGSLIKNHNDIWGNEIMDFLRDMILIGVTPDLATYE
jgi:Alpha/beta hydrolase of unknown function (DUF900)